MASQVVENDDNMTIPVPGGDYNTIEPFAFLEKTFGNSSLIILNQKIEAIDLKLLWKCTSLHICADGGANRLYEYCNGDDKLIPDFIVGDFDSADESVLEFYRLKGSVIIPQYTQYASDFMKSLHTLILYYHSKESKEKLYGDIEVHEGLSVFMDQLGDLDQTPDIHVYILNGLGGRFDQTIHSINQTIVFKQKHPYLTSYFITADDLVFLLPKGKNYIKYPSKQLFFKSLKNPVCGLLPLNGLVTLNTNGLKWDVRNWETSMKGHVSSSNALVSHNGVIIECTDDIMINIELMP